MKKFLKPIVQEITEVFGRGNNTCSSSGQGNANTCQNVGSGY